MVSHGRSSRESCQASIKSEYRINLGDIHSIDPYLNFVPQSYGHPGVEELQSWGSDSDTLKAVIDLVKPKFMIEVGSWKGASAVKFAKWMKEANPSTNCFQLICVDTWLGTTRAWYNPDMENPADGNDLHLRNGYPSVYYQFLTNMMTQQVDNVVVPLPLPSVMGAIFLQQKGVEVDLVYIDGCHDEECVYQDIEQWWKVVRTGGVLFGDDYNRPGVKNAVARYCQQAGGGCVVDTVMSSSRTWVMKKLQ